MRICIGAMILNEEACLKELWPSFVRKFDGIVVLENGSKDGSRKVLESVGAHIIDNPNWDYDCGNGRNIVIKKAEELGYDAMMILDADEALFPRDVDFIRQLHGRLPYFTLPKLALWKDYEHWWPPFTPDYVCRNFRLNKGVIYRGKIHEKIQCPKLSMNIPQEFSAYIYHYGHVKHHLDKLFTHHNLNLARKGRPLIMSPLKEWGDNPPLADGQPLKRKHPMSGKDPSPIQKRFYV